MYKFINTLLFLIVILFIFSVYSYYFSKKNVSIKNFNRSNVDNLLKEKLIGLPVLNNDTNNVIEFNDQFDEEIGDKKKRSFWDLMKIK